MRTPFIVLGLVLVLGCEREEAEPAPRSETTRAAPGAVVPGDSPAPTAEPEPPPSLLLDEPFADLDSLAAWHAIDGAMHGDAPVSTVTWDEGAVRFEGTPATARWTALAREVETGGARWLRLQARMRTRDVDPSRARFHNCNVFVKHAGALVASAPLIGTHDWTAVERTVELPPGTATVSVGVFLSMPGTAWFDDVRLEAVDAPAWSELVEGHYRYHTLPGDAVPPAARAFNEDAYASVSTFLALEHGPAQVDYYKYPSVEVVASLTGHRGNAHRDGTAIHTIWATDRHEIVHVLADAWGDPPALLAEGLAVHLSGHWQGEPVIDAARAVLVEGRWIAPSALLDSAAFRGHDDLVTYPVSGAFVAWLLEVHGHEQLRTLYGSLANRDARDLNAARLEAALGMPLDQIDRAMRSWLETR